MRCFDFWLAGWKGYYNTTTEEVIEYVKYVFSLQATAISLFINHPMTVAILNPKAMIVAILNPIG